MRNLIEAVANLGVDFKVMAGRDTVDFVDMHDPDLWENKEIRYFLHSEARKEDHIVAFENDRIVAMGGVQTNPSDPRHLWIKFISIRPSHQGRGLARAILEHIYQFAVEHEQKLAPGSFTEEGERLAHLHDEFDAKYPEAAFEKRGKHYYNAEGKIVR